MQKPAGQCWGGLPGCFSCFMDCISKARSSMDQERLLVSPPEPRNEGINAYAFCLAFFLINSG